MTMPTIHKILATTALCLAAVGLSSCCSQVHQYIWQKAKVAENAEWFDNNNSIELFSDGKHVYAKGNRGTVRGCFIGGPIALLIPIHGGPGGYASFEPSNDDTTPIYYRLDADEAREVRKAEVAGKQSVHIFPWFGELTTLPAHAKALTVKGETSEKMKIDGHPAYDEDVPYTTDAHKYYAYPLGVLTAVAVDAPLTLATNAVSLVCCAAGAAIGLPYAGVHAIYESCTQNAPDAEPSPESGNIMP